MEDDIDTQLALVRKDLDNFTRLFTKLDDTVNKISEVSNDVSKLLALHEQRLETLYQNDRLLEVKMEKNVGDFAEEIKELHHHIRSNNRDLAEKLKLSEDSIKSDIKYIRDSIDRENKALKESIDSTNEDIKVNQERIVALEKWRWYTAGCIAAIIWLLNKTGFSISIIP